MRSILMIVCRIFVVFNLLLVAVFCQRRRHRQELSTRDIETWSKKFGREFNTLALSYADTQKITKAYTDAGAFVEPYEPEKILNHMVDRLTKYLNKRKLLAKVLKQSLESGSKLDLPTKEPLPKDWKCYEGSVDTQLKCLEENANKSFRFVDARNDERLNENKESGNASQSNKNSSDYSITVKYKIHGIKNPNFYNYEVDISRSAVHVPVPVFKYDWNLLKVIHWSGELLDSVFMDSRKLSYPSASWQFYCSPDGFMRFYPAMKWKLEEIGKNCVDLYDCRNTEWFVDGATSAKNLIILLDMSGSMFGQRFEIAKRTLNVLFETLSENDFFNIIKFNHNSIFTISCFNKTLLQATLMNKEMMKENLNKGEILPEGMANLNFTWTLVSETLENIENKTENFGCNTAIVLITDASADFQAELFRKLIGPKNVRLFAFVIGNDVSLSQAKDVEELALRQHGSMNRIHNLADAQQKVQSYLDIMSRSIAQRDQNRAIWTGIHQDKLSNNFVSTVAYAVVINSTFKGVVGANAPLTELKQMAAVYMLGANSYSFLTDNNGYVMFHPQIRSYIRPGKPKPNYNSMDFMELEVLQQNSMLVDGTTFPIPVDYNHPLRKNLADGGSTEDDPSSSYKLQVLIAMDGVEKLKRVYKQENVYYHRGINGTFMTLGLAVPPKSRSMLGYRTTAFKVDSKWFGGSDWRLQPNWHYCRPSDSDGHLTKEQIFLNYMKEYETTGKLPEKCANYNYLINRLLHDAKILAGFPSDFITHTDSRKGVYSVFIATQTGMTKYTNFELDGILNETTEVEHIFQHNETTTIIRFKPPDDKPHLPFLGKYIKGLSEAYYRRAMINSDQRFTVDVDINDSVYVKNGSIIQGFFDIRKTPLIRVTKSIFLVDGSGNRAPVGVHGFEMLYASFAEMFVNETNNHCLVGSPNRCYLLDEHGYIVYTSVTKNTSILERYYLGQFFGNTPHVERLPENMTRFPSDLVDAKVPLDLLEYYTFTKLVEMMIYENFTYIDYQAMCTKEDRGQKKSYAFRIPSPLLAIANLVLRVIRAVVELLSNIALCIIFEASLFHRSSSYISMQRDSAEDGSPCDKWSPYYVLNRTAAQRTVQLFNKRLNCLRHKEGSGDKLCQSFAFASMVPNTNLLLVVVNATDQCQTEQCLNVMIDFMPMFGMREVKNATDKFYDSTDCKYEPRYRRSSSVCYAADDEAFGTTWSRALKRTCNFYVHFSVLLSCLYRSIL